MANYDDIFNASAQKGAEDKSFVSFNKEEWAAQKKQERESAFAMIDETAQRMANDGGLFQSYLDVQARFDRYSVGNAVLITAQKADATQLSDFKGWKNNGVFIKKGESGIVLLEPGEEYTKEDGTVGVSYNSKKVFDISQTTAKAKDRPAMKRDERLLLKAIIHNAPCPIEISQKLPENINAVYRPDDKKIYVNIVHQVFQIAVDDDMIRSNPAANMLREIKMAHGSEIEKRKALTLEQEELFLGYLARTPKYQHWYPVFYIMANTGMRVGEITGLRWCDVDMENGIISVNHTLVYYNHRDEKGCYFSINTPKTKAGIREIPMTEGVKQAFLMEKEFQEECGMKSVSHIEGYSDFVFVNRNGEVQHQGTLNKALQRIMRDCNSEVLEKKGVDSDPVLLPKFSCHVLRHTFATRMCESGLNVKVVQSVLGHADVTTTLDIYVTVTNDLKKREITAFETYLKTGAKQMANV